MRFAILLSAVLLSGAFFLAQAATDIAAQAGAGSGRGGSHETAAGHG